SRPKSEDVLHELLADLKRRGLDLTGRISYDPMCRSGGGGYGDVFRSSYNHNVLGRVNVAIKRVRFYIDSNQDIARVVAREVKVWSRLEHPNILPFLGFIVEESGFSSLVSEWMDNGTVSIYIKNHPKCNLMRIILGIAEGLAYLHDKNVIHADLKSDNVLISHKEVPLICDFGISKILAATQTLGGVCSQNDTPKGTVRWMAIELVRPYVNLNNDQASEQKAPEHTKESDVWSFGMTVYELLAKQFPYQHIHMDIVVMIAISNGALPACPASFAIWPIYQKSVWTICESCWNYDPSQRPQVLDVVQEMKILCSHAGQE
ncbi:kinase-like domain-containing protein, partial [Phellopilus nigrolimitatus]